MPCSSDGYECVPSEKEQRASWEYKLRHDSELAQMLCFVMTSLESASYKDLAFDAIMKDILFSRSDVTRWWQEHQLRDAQKRKLEEKEKERLETIKAAKAKLTPLERKLLGVK